MHLCRRFSINFHLCGNNEKINRYAFNLLVHAIMLFTSSAGSRSNTALTNPVFCPRISTTIEIVPLGFS